MTVKDIHNIYLISGKKHVENSIYIDAYFIKECTHVK